MSFPLAVFAWKDPLSKGWKNRFTSRKFLGAKNAISLDTLDRQHAIMDRFSQSDRRHQWAKNRVKSFLERRKQPLTRVMWLWFVSTRLVLKDAFNRLRAPQSSSSTQNTMMGKISLLQRDVMILKEKCADAAKEGEFLEAQAEGL